MTWLDGATGRGFFIQLININCLISPSNYGIYMAFHVMKYDIRIDLLKRADGRPLLRLQDTVSGRTLKTPLDAQRSFVSQKTHTIREFHRLLQTDLIVA
jgi:hypothetical protein